MDEIERDKNPKAPPMQGDEIESGAALMEWLKGGAIHRMVFPHGQHYAREMLKEALTAAQAEIERLNGEIGRLRNWLTEFAMRHAPRFDDEIGAALSTRQGDGE